MNRIYLKSIAANAPKDAEDNLERNMTKFEFVQNIL